MCEHGCWTSKRQRVAVAGAGADGFLAAGLPASLAFAFAGGSAVEFGAEGRRVEQVKMWNPGSLPCIEAKPSAIFLQEQGESRKSEIRNRRLRPQDQGRSPCPRGVLRRVAALPDLR